jgi:DUF4097 and DUF4098 domain-containing protein YvlB
MNTQKPRISKIMAATGFSFFMMMSISSAKALQVSNKKPYRTKEFSITAPGQLKVQTSGGNIKVAGSKGSRVRVELYAAKNGKNLNPADTKLEQFNINIKKEGNSIIAVAKRKKASNWKFWKRHNISISFVVQVPRKMSASLNTSGGNIIVSGLSGTQRIRTSGGSLKLANLEGDIKARSSGGNINISGINGKLNARTSGGGISVQNTKGSLSVHTSGGNLNLKNIAGEVSASTSGGSIDAYLTQVNHSVQLRTSGGNIHIMIPKNIGLNLDLRGSYMQNTRLKNFSGTVKHNEVKGTINGGGPELSARTSGGTVHISYR